MTRRRKIAPRRVIFVGVEGKSEQGFVWFVRHCCERIGLHFHWHITVANGGDSVTVVEHAGRQLDACVGRVKAAAKLVLLDEDRIAEDKRAGRDAAVAAERLELQLILQIPNLEGVLLRLHAGSETRKVDAKVAIRELRKKWPAYDKPATVLELQRRFGLSDLQRAAEHDEQLRRLLELIGLPASL